MTARLTAAGISGRPSGMGVLHSKGGVIDFLRWVRSIRFYRIGDEYLAADRCDWIPGVSRSRLRMLTLAISAYFWTPLIEVVSTNSSPLMPHTAALGEHPPFEHEGRTFRTTLIFILGRPDAIQPAGGVKIQNSKRRDQLPKGNNNAAMSEEMLTIGLPSRGDPVRWQTVFQDGSQPERCGVHMLTEPTHRRSHAAPTVSSCAGTCASSPPW